jgi:hypothetical protein
MKTHQHFTGFVTLSILVAATGALSADDWPQWRGPNRDGISRETGLLKEWPQAGPKLLWKATVMGSGYSRKRPVHPAGPAQAVGSHGKGLGLSRGGGRTTFHT